MARMAPAAKKRQKLQSYRIDVSMDMEMKLSVFGQDMDIDMKVNNTTDANTSPDKTKSEMTMEMLGEKVTVLGYTEKTDTGLVTYSSTDGGKTWSRTSVEGDEQAKASDLSNFSELLKLASSFEETGSETVRGSEATVYSGVIPSETMEKILQMSSMLESVLETMNLSLDDVELEELGSVPVTIALDNKSGMVVRYTMDLSEMMAKLMPVMFNAIVSEAVSQMGLEGLDLEQLGFKVETGRVFATGELYDFDAVGTIEIPAEALNAPELEAA